MGSCQTSNVVEVNNKEEAKAMNNKKKTTGKKDVETLIKEQKEEFPDMEEWEGERYKGIGIKRMKGYKCNLQIDKLIQKRDDFWTIRNRHEPENPNYKTWRIINQACVYDEYRANMLLGEANLRTFQGCINHIVDEKGNHYIVPNYCINDPYFEKEFKIQQNVEKKKLKINLYEVANNKNTPVEVSNLISGEELKKLFCEKNNVSFDDFNIRMFFSGIEVSNDHFLYQYNIQNDFKIQVMRVPRIKSNEKKEEKTDKNKQKDFKDEEGEVVNNNEGV